ncbi:hypothetical protein ASC96_28075 [Rhizobium sp. Root1204]|nr:hypothetical protein ASC96_28075 [Rhizobium sp. Root1204]
MMDSHGFRRNRSTWIDHQRTALSIEFPSPVPTLDHILPADLADILRPITSRLQIDHADELDCCRIIRRH